uniref:Uncharacterized protein LOC114335044 n=1 Tax=Diabrotica virgifera virgifera TaxID=50390 RepID=A0A6P7G938_DIAVI
MTQVRIISTNDNSLPPVFVFPPICCDKLRMMAGTVHGVIGRAYESGWMATENFVLVQIFFKDNVRCDNEHSVLLLTHNHDSHLSLDLQRVSFFRGHGITILTLSPHTSNYLQYLYRCVFGQFKKYYSQLMDVHHSSETLSIYSVPELSSKAWDRAATPENV